MAKLTTKGRDAIKAKNFALPGKRYPIEDASHARNALARVSQHGSPAEKAEVRSKVKSKYPGIGVKTPKPDHPRNPGPYDTEAHTTTHHGDTGRAVGVKGDLTALGGLPTPTNEERGVVVAQDTDGARHHPSMSTTAHKFAPPAAPGAHGWGHPAHQRAGSLRLSGAKSAHRVGKR